MSDGGLCQYCSKPCKTKGLTRCERYKVRYDVLEDLTIDVCAARCLYAYNYEGVCGLNEHFGFELTGPPSQCDFDD